MIKISSLFTYWVYIPFKNRIERSKEIRLGVFNPSYLLVYLFMVKKQALTWNFDFLFCKSFGHGLLLKLYN